MSESIGDGCGDLLRGGRWPRRPRGSRDPVRCPRGEEEQSKQSAGQTESQTQAEKTTTPDSL